MSGNLSISEPDQHVNHLMAVFNLTPSDPSTFILTGIPSLEATHLWISIPFSRFYIISLLGNFTVLYVVGKEQILYKPVYLLFCMLTLTDIATSTLVVPVGSLGLLPLDGSLMAPSRADYCHTNERVAAVLVFTSTPSYLRDTTDFLRKLQYISDLPENTILATMDVEALYTNIPHKDGLQAIGNGIPDNVVANLVAELCDFVLTHNYFTFGDNVYLQISGTAMGTRMAPQHANIFMADLEQSFLSSHPLMPLLYLRYVDDIFIIWTHGKEVLEEFHHDFNNFHPTINLSLDQSTQEIHFLDTTVLISDGHINTTLYRKPTDRYSYLHASSFHPDHTTLSIVHSQALRYNRICSNPSDRDKHLQDLYQAFLQLQYPPAGVKKQIDRARRVPRSHLLQDRPNKENNRTPLAVTFSPQLKPLQRIIKDLPSILKDDPSLSQILGDRQVLAYRQPPNLKQILTSNHTPHNRTTNLGTYPCNKAHCQLCPLIYSGDTIIGPNHISHTIRGSFTCTSTNVIYAIMCQQCPSAMYIGQTGQSLCKRINGHKSDVKNYNIHKPVGEHFNLSGHSITDLKVAILQQKEFKNRLQRETAELELICKLTSA
ncbi:unnamed protein product [Natator depressus]